MARTAKTTLKIKNAGVLLGSSFDTLDLLTNISAVDSGNGVAGVSATGGAGGTNMATEKLTPTTSGANITLDLTGLAHVFTAIQGVYKNGILIDASDATFGWSRSTNTITVLNGSNTDIFYVQYNY